MSVEFEKMACIKFDKLDKFQEDVYKRFDKIDEKFDKIDEKFARIDKKFDSIDHTLEVIKESLILIEDQVMFKIPALFDGYSMHQQKQEILEDNINSVNRKVEDHDIRISILEQQSV